MLGSFSVMHWMIFAIVALLLFGGKDKISNIMGDFGKGLREMKNGLAEVKEHDADIRKSLSEKL